MKPARIKQITTEMVIAWGMICIVFYVYDMIFQDLNIAVIKSGYGPTGALYNIPYFLIMITNFVSMYILGLFQLFFLHIKMNIATARILSGVIIVAIQFFLYWYLGRFLAWIYIRFHPSVAAELQENNEALPPKQSRD